MPLAEAQFRRAMAISQGDLSVFVTRPLSLAILASAAAELAMRYLLSISQITDVT